MQDCKCLIVGAGPVGLALANLLIHYGIDFRIIDKKATISEHSKALVIHARTLELFENLNLTHNFIKQGNKVEHANIYADEKQIAEINFTEIPSSYNYMLSISQHDTEKILEENLLSKHKNIEWNKELVELRNLQFQHQVKIRNDKQEIEEEVFDYILGCDGAHSTCRKQAGIDFEGGSYDYEFFLADVVLESDLKQNSVYGFLTSQRVLFLAPFKEAHRWRIITTVPKDYEGDRNTASIDDIHKLTQEIKAIDLKIETANWLGFFHVHHRMVNEFRKGNLFLLGDAAHIHSPIGGQGMNAGIHDAFNLAAKLAAVLIANQDSSLLDEYEAERKPIDNNIIKGTDAATKFILTRNFLTHNLQKFLIPKLAENEEVMKRLLRNAAMLPDVEEPSSPESESLLELLSQ